MDEDRKEREDECQPTDQEVSSADEPVLLESVALPSPKNLLHPSDDSRSRDFEEQHVISDHLDSSSVETAMNVSQQTSSAATCLVNTSEGSLAHHAGVLSSTVPHSSSQTDDVVQLGVGTRSEVSNLMVNSAEPVSKPADGVYSSVVSSHGAKRGPSPILSVEQEISPVKSETNSPGPVMEDRHLEQFSEILLDSDHSQSDGEAEESSLTVDSEAKMKPKKKVRFADEVEERPSGLARSGTHSPPLRPTALSSPEDVARQGRVPVSPSLPKQPVASQAAPQFSINDLIAGVDFSAQYLGSTPIFLSGMASAKSSRMYQAQQAVKLIKDPDNEGRPQSAVNIKISTQAITISDNRTNVDMMEHPLHTIAYVADIDNVLVVMAHVVPVADSTPPSPVTTPVENREELVESYIPKMTCHVLDTDNARNVAMVIGQAFSAAYKQFLRSNGISEEALEQAEYAHILNAQTVPQVEVESFNDRNKTRKLTLAKRKGEVMGVMVMEAGYGSAIPSCVIAHLSKTGAAMRSGLLNVGDHIITINGVNLVGMHKKTCIEQLKKCRYQDVVKMTVCSCPPVVEVTIVRPDLKYQLGFSVQRGMITSLIRGSIAERSGIRVGHRIIEINGTSTVSMDHNDIVHLLSCTVGDLHLRTMPDLMYKLLTGQITPDYH